MVIVALVVVAVTVKGVAPQLNPEHRVETDGSFVEQSAYHRVGYLRPRCVRARGKGRGRGLSHCFLGWPVALVKGAGVFFPGARSRMNSLVASRGQCRAWPNAAPARGR